MSSSDYLPYIQAAALALAKRKDDINKLNVFPVPDGDTGTNMSLTIETVVREVAALPESASFADVRKAITHGSLMGARGNSGVITSQILRGLCEGLEGITEFDAPSMAKALERATAVAFQAVRKPVEGTILTVLRDTAQAARQAADEKKSRDEALRFISEVAFASVKRTPELLPVLKENGVVDAGGFGLALLIEGFVRAVTGGTVELPTIESISKPEPQVAIEQIDDWEGSEYLYCTEFLLISDGLDVDEAQEFLGGLGDCELLVGSAPDFKVHVHTNDPGMVLSYMTDRGQVSEVHIHNMSLQSQERARTLQEQDGGVTAPLQLKELGFIAVAAGEGMHKILTSLGVDYIVNGGQTMNPSTKDLLDAINAIAAKKVIVFPNNKNIILAANAAAEVSEKPVAVVPTKSVPQAFSALFLANPEAGLEENARAMSEAIKDVRTAEVTVAIKDAKSANGKPINSGDIIGIANDSIEVVGSELGQVTLELVAMLHGDEADTLTILAGDDLDQEGFDSILQDIEETYPDLEVDAHRGDQPLYPLVMAIE